MTTFKKSSVLVNHRLLRRNLNSMVAHIILLLRSYSSEKSKKVYVNGCFDESAGVNCGVSRGPIVAIFFFYCE